MSRSRRDSGSQEDPLSPPPDKDNADRKPAWNKPSSSSAEGGPVMGAESWPALSVSARASSNKSPSSSDLSAGSPVPLPQQQQQPPSENHHNVNGQRKPFRRNNSTPSSGQNESQRGAGTSSQSRNSQRYRNGSSYPRGDGVNHHGNRRNLEHQTHRRDMHLQQPQRGFGMMRPQLLMGPPPSFAAGSAQFMAAPQYGGGPMLYPDYPPHVFVPHPPPESMPLSGHLPHLPIFVPSFDAALLYNKIFTQVEYYFSADNLSKDKHLRCQMNDEGWVPVRVIAGFRRLAELTNNIQTILEALRSSQVVEIKGEAVRRRGDWDKYLLPREASRSGPAAVGNNNASLGSQLESMTLSERSKEGES